MTKRLKPGSQSPTAKAIRRTIGAKVRETGVLLQWWWINNNENVMFISEACTHISFSGPDFKKQAKLLLRRLPNNGPLLSWNDVPPLLIDPGEKIPVSPGAYQFIFVDHKTPVKLEFFGPKPNTESPKQPWSIGSGKMCPVEGCEREAQPTAMGAPSDVCGLHGFGGPHKMKADK